MKREHDANRALAARARGADAIYDRTPFDALVSMPPALVLGPRPETVAEREQRFIEAGIWPVYTP